MVMFVHLAPEAATKPIRRAGIKTSRIRLPDLGPSRGVYAFPVLPNFTVSHQWLRELKRSGVRTIFGVYFRIPDDEPVLTGHFGRKHKSMMAAQAVGLLNKISKPEGYQVIVPRKIKPKEIHKIRRLPQITGWRYHPNAHGQKPCGCPVCWEPGAINSQRTRQNWLAEEKAMEEKWGIENPEDWDDDEDEDEEEE